MITGDIGTGKTTLCRAILEQLDHRTFTALVLNPFLSEEDLLKLILQDFGVLSREEVRRGVLANVSKQDLIDTLNDFLLSLLPLNAGALLIIDEAQNLTMGVLEQIRILSNLETDKEKLLQIVLVGQLNLKSLLRAPEMRQLSQRVSIRYELTPLNGEEVAAYAAHRLAIAGGATSVMFTPPGAQPRSAIRRWHSEADQPALRSRVVGWLLCAHEPHRPGDDCHRGREPRSSTPTVASPRVASAPVRAGHGRPGGGCTDWRGRGWLRVPADPSRGRRPGARDVPVPTPGVGICATVPAAA